MTRYDGNQINAAWGDAWPQGNDPTDTDHNASPLLQAPVANLLGSPWMLAPASPAGDYITWLRLDDGRAVLVSPHPDDNGIVRWAISIIDGDGTPLVFAHQLPIDAAPADVVTQVHSLMTQFGITIPGAGFAQAVCAAWNNNQRI